MGLLEVTEKVKVLQVGLVFDTLNGIPEFPFKSRKKKTKTKTKTKNKTKKQNKTKTKNKNKNKKNKNKTTKNKNKKTKTKTKKHPYFPFSWSGMLTVLYFTTHPIQIFVFCFLHIQAYGKNANLRQRIQGVRREHAHPVGLRQKQPNQPTFG